MNDLAKEINELAEKLKTPTGDNDEDLATLGLLIEKTTEFRNRLEKKMKYSSPLKKKILRTQIVDLDNQLTQFRHGFVKFKAKCLEDKRIQAEKDAELDKLFDETDLLVAKMYIIAKHQMPTDFFKELERSIVDNLTPELVEDFYEIVAHLEATQLEDILAGKYI